MHLLHMPSMVTFPNTNKAGGGDTIISAWASTSHSIFPPNLPPVLHSNSCKEVTFTCEKKAKQDSSNTDLAMEACRSSPTVKQLDFLLTPCPSHIYSPLPYSPASFEDAGT